MKYSWILMFWLFLLDTSNAYIFTQNKGRIFVCDEPKDGYCKRRDAIFTGQRAGLEEKRFHMNLGFWKDATFKYGGSANISDYGYPVFYEYVLDDNKLNVDMIILNGLYDVNDTKSVEYFYVSLIDDERKCKSARPKKEEETLTGGLYLNQKYSKYAYYIYHSASKSLTCILSIKFEDLRQGNYNQKELVPIKAHEIHLIENEVQNFIDPLFSIDPIFGTMVFFTTNEDNIWKAVHYKIDENNLTKLEPTLFDQLTINKFSQYDEWEKLLSYMKNPRKMFKNSQGLFPAFSSYGKSTFLFFPKFDGKAIVAFWAAHDEIQKPGAFLKDDHRHLYYFDSDSFENGEPVGKFIETTLIPTSSSAVVPSTSTPESNCNGSLYLGLFITFAIIDFILMLALLSLGFLIWFGSKKMKKFRQYQQNNKRGRKQSNFPGAPKTTTLGISAVTGTMAPETVAPTNLNTQEPTKATTVGQTQAANGTKATGVNQTTQAPISADVGTTAAGKTTKLQTWESKQA